MILETSTFPLVNKRLHVLLLDLKSDTLFNNQEDEKANMVKGAKEYGLYIIQDIDKGLVARSASLLRLRPRNYRIGPSFQYSQYSQSCCNSSVQQG